MEKRLDLVKPLVNDLESCAIDIFNQSQQRADVVLGIGDDAALCDVPAGQQLVVSTDHMIEGVHFLSDTSPYDLGYKALAVSLSDMAAMGATPAWALLSLSIPQFDRTWLEALAKGFFELACEYNVQLIGGDTTSGPRMVNTQVLGWLPPGTALRRDAAQRGDYVGVTGTLGDAGLGLKVLLQEISLGVDDEHYVLERLYRPKPRIEAGQLLREKAHSAIDVSDGLLSDVTRLLDSSHCGMVLQLAPSILSEPMHRAYTHKRGHLDREAWELALSAGDDYELCFTCAPQHWPDIQLGLRALQQPCLYLGRVISEPGVCIIDPDGAPFHATQSGYRHFSDSSEIDREGR